jgi:hypothetical protein
MHSCVRSWKCIQRERWNIQISVDLTCFHQTIVHFYSWIKFSIDEQRRCGKVAVKNEQIAHFLHSLCFHTWAIAVAWILSHGSTITVLSGVHSCTVSSSHLSKVYAHLFQDSRPKIHTFDSWYVPYINLLPLYQSSCHLSNSASSNSNMVSHIMYKHLNQLLYAYLLEPCGITASTRGIHISTTMASVTVTREVLVSISRTGVRKQSCSDA